MPVPSSFAARLPALVVLLVSAAMSPTRAQEPSAGQSPAKQPSAAPVPAADRWEKEIAAMEARDRESPPPQAGIVFVGSSSIRLWNVREGFPDLPVVNRGFGGSQMSDSLRYAPRIVTPLAPRVVVVYAGDNDLKAGKTPAQVAADFDALATLIHRALPHTQVWCLGVKPSPSRWTLIDSQRQTNALLRARCERDAVRMAFLDVEPLMLGPDGKPDESLFAKDKLHLSPAGYARWNKLLHETLAQRKPLEKKPG